MFSVCLLLYVLLGLGGAIGTVLGGGLRAAWALLLWPGYTLVLTFLHIAVFALSSFLLKKTPLDRIRDGAWSRLFFCESVRLAMCLLRVRVHVEGKDMLPRDKRAPFLFVSNHVSHFDPMVQSVLLYGRRILFLTKPENLALPVVGRYLVRTGFLPIDRREPKRAMEAVHTAVRRILEDGCTVGVYPEGTISKGPSLLGFHDGVFLMAKKADVPVLVSTVRGTERIRRGLLCPWTDVYITYEQWIPQDRVRETRPVDLSREVRAIMRESLLRHGYDAPPPEEAEVADLAAISDAQAARHAPDAAPR